MRRLYHGTDASAGGAIAATGVLAVTAPAGHRSYVTDRHALALGYVMRAVARRLHRHPDEPALGAIIVLAGELPADARPDALCEPHEYLVIRPLPVEKVITLDLSAVPVIRDPVMRRVADRTSAWVQASTYNVAAWPESGS